MSTGLSTGIFFALCDTLSRKSDTERGRGRGEVRRGGGGGVGRGVCPLANHQRVSLLTYLEYLATYAFHVILAVDLFLPALHGLLTTKKSTWRKEGCEERTDPDRTDALFFARLNTRDL